LSPAPVDRAIECGVTISAVCTALTFNWGTINGTNDFPHGDGFRCFGNLHASVRSAAGFNQTMFLEILDGLYDSMPLNAGVPGYLIKFDGSRSYTTRQILHNLNGCDGARCEHSIICYCDLIILFVGYYKFRNKSITKRQLGVPLRFYRYDELFDDKENNCSTGDSCR